MEIIPKGEETKDKLSCLFSQFVDLINNSNALALVAIIIMSKW